MYVRLGVCAADDAVLVAAIEDGARAEAAAGARQLAAIAELLRRRVDDDDERSMWAFDPWDSVAAEVASALNVGHRRAWARCGSPLALRDRLPRVEALYRQGVLSSRIVSSITWLTHLVEDEQALALIDAALADRAPKWGPLSEDKLRQAVEVWVSRYDPDAVRRTRPWPAAVTSRRCLRRHDRNHLGVGTTAGRRCRVLQQRVTAMARGVCDGDPRSMGERRADALGALAAGNQQLACACGSPTCPVAGEQPSPMSSSG